MPVYRIPEGEWNNIKDGDPITEGDNRGGIMVGSDTWFIMENEPGEKWYVYKAEEPPTGYYAVTPDVWPPLEDMKYDSEVEAFEQNNNYYRWGGDPAPEVLELVPYTP